MVFEHKYEIIDKFGDVLAECRSLDMAFAFVKGFSIIKFYNETLELTIREVKNDETNAGDECNIAANFYKSMGFDKAINSFPRENPTL